MSRLLVCSLLLLAGVASAKTNRILGGEDTNIEFYPSVVQVEFLVGLVWVQTCAGSVLTSQFILTAAQCSSGIFFNRYTRRIIAGSSYRGTGDHISGLVSVNNHPNYGQARHQYDISVWRITPLPYTDSIAQGTIVAYGVTLPANSPVVKVGWGATEEDGEPAEVLQTANALVISSEICSQRLGEGVKIEITENILCTGNGDNSVSATVGDAGGPVYYDNIIVGVISWGQSKANETRPGSVTLSTAVSPLSDWIVYTAS